MVGNCRENRIALPPSASSQFGIGDENVELRMAIDEHLSRPPKVPCLIPSPLRRLRSAGFDLVPPAKRSGRSAGRSLRGIMPTKAAPGSRQWLFAW